MSAVDAIRIAIITGSTRPGSRGAMVSEWVRVLATAAAPDRPGLQIETIDLAEVNLPMLDEPLPAAIGHYSHEHTRRWASIVHGFDGFIFVTPEYNHSFPASLKNAIDYLFAEWNDKAAGFVSYGLSGGTRAVEHLRNTLAEVKVACVRSQVALGLFTDFEIPDMAQPGTLSPARHHEQIVLRMLDEVIDWSRALRPLRTRPRP